MRLKVVEVGQRNRYRPAIALRAGNLAGRDMHELAAIVEAGQHVGRRQAFEFSPRFLVLLQDLVQLADRGFDRLDLMRAAGRQTKIGASSRSFVSAESIRCSGRTRRRCISSSNTTMKAVVIASVA